MMERLGDAEKIQVEKYKWVFFDSITITGPKIMQKKPVTNKKHEEHRTDQTKESVKHTN